MSEFETVTELVTEELVTEESAEAIAPAPELRPSLEAVLMVADQPLDHLTLATAVGHPADDVLAALDALADEYTDQGRGFELRNVAGGWRYYTREAHAGVVEAFVLEGQQSRLTQAALETLAVVAYKQPVSRARVSAIRGVNVDGVMRTLLTRGLVEEAGADQETGANLYRTTNYFLERIGITSLDDLPELAPFLPEIDDFDDDLAAFAGGGGAEASDIAPSGPDTSDAGTSDAETSDADTSDAVTIDADTSDADTSDADVSDTQATPAATAEPETMHDVPEEQA